MWQSFDDSEPTAAKEHKCIWCGERILEGEKYHLQTGKWEGEFQSNRYHGECFKAASGYWDIGEGGFEPHSFKRGTLEEK